MLPDLTLAEFDRFVHQVHSFDGAFPWQRRAVTAAVTGAGWPERVAVPTGLGKTLLLDGWVFALALQADRPPPQRTITTRAAWIVPRRSVVDQVARHARHVAEALTRAHPDSVAGRVAQRLQAIGRGPTPLSVEHMRGGITWPTDWTVSVAQPTVLAATVDQFGSRLLFRGYRSSPRRWPVEAGLVGIDCTLFADEAHLTEPLLETVQQIRQLQANAEEVPTGRPLRVARLSATLADTDGPVLALNDDDLAHPVVAQRVAANKTLRLVTAKPRRDPDVAGLLVHQLGTELGHHPATRVLLVTNRVADAQAAHRSLKTHPPDGFTPEDVLLLVGPMRDLDRTPMVDDVLDRLAPRTKAGDGRSTLLVATQTVEVGLDLDSDLLVTEACPMPALAQRAGRVDRRGVTQAGRIVVMRLADPDDLGPYRRAGWSCADWLAGHAVSDGTVDASPARLTELSSAAPPDAQAPARDVPLLTPPVVRLLAQTHPVPNPSPQPAPYMAGVEPARGPGMTVQVAARADLTGTPDRWGQRVARWTILPHELVDLSFDHAVRWLRAAEPDAHVVLLRHASAEPQVVQATQAARLLSDGCVIVGPTTVTPLTAHGWDTTLKAVGTDVADHHPDVPRLRVPLERLQPNDPGRPAVADGLPLDPAAVAALVAADDRFHNVPEVTAEVDEDRILLEAPQLAVAGSDETDLSSSLATGRVDPSFEGHAQAVAAAAAHHSTAVAGPGSVAELARIAGLLHDAGKADPRFQAFLGAHPDQLVAKSSGRPGPWTPQPRHEAVSELVALAWPDLEESTRDVVAHLVGASHGRGRPWPQVRDLDGHTVGAAEITIAGTTVTVDLDRAAQPARHHAERFSRLNEQFSPWGLAWLEAAVRLADIAVSTGSQPE